MTPAETGLARLNGAAPAEAAESLGACCASPVWVTAMIAGRPFRTLADLLSASAAGLERLDWDQVLAALRAHPRIGERITGAATEAVWSRREQAGTDSSSDEVRARLVEANRAYEERFGHVFLIFATGRADTEMLAAALSRLTNSDEQERLVVRGELGRIVALRVERMVSAA